MEEESSLEVECESDLSEVESINYEEYGIKFPLPPHEDESLCRDEFLKKLFEPFEKTENLLARKTLPSDIFPQRSRRTGTIGGMQNAEAMAIIRMIRKNRNRIVEFEESTEFKVSLSVAQKQIIFKKFIVQFQKDAIEYLSVRLKKRLEVLVNIWPGEVTKIPYNLFHWSVEHFVTRTRISQLYLDVLTIENSKISLNCAKFCTDVHEIIRLLDAIRQDIRLDEDVCKNSIVLMNNANYDQTAPWIKDLDKNRMLRNKLALEVFAHHDTRDTSLRNSALAVESKRHDAYMPIELRYRINWIRSNGEQHLMWLQEKEKVFQNELDQLREQMREDALAFEFDDYVTNLQIDKFRMDIVKWEEQLEVEMESMELKGSITSNLLTKAQDDLKFYRDQVEMFKIKVAQVLQQEEEEEETKRLQAYRRGTKLSLASLRKKKKQEKKEKQVDSKKKWSKY